MQRLFASLMAWAFLVLAIAMPMQSYARSTLVVQSVIELTAPPGLVAVQKQDAAVSAMKMKKTIGLELGARSYGLASGYLLIASTFAPMSAAVRLEDPGAAGSPPPSNA